MSSPWKENVLETGLFLWRSSIVKVCLITPIVSSFEESRTNLHLSKWTAWCFFFPWTLSAWNCYLYWKMITSHRVGCCSPRDGDSAVMWSEVYCQKWRCQSRKCRTAGVGNDKICRLQQFIYSSSSAINGKIAPKVMVSVEDAADDEDLLTTLDPVFKQVKHVCTSARVWVDKQKSD